MLVDRSWWYDSSADAGALLTAVSATIVRHGDSHELHELHELALVCERHGVTNVLLALDVMLSGAGAR
jgi:hypothetical protein